MRSDMDKVLVMRPRIRGWRSVRRRRGRAAWAPRGDVGQTYRREAMSRGRGSKFLNENLAPLRRYLVRQAGRRWDDVYSEIAARVDPSSAVKRHILEHLGDMVDQHPILVDGCPHYAVHSRSGAEVRPRYRSRLSVAFVDRRGLLRLLPERPRSRPR